jgi:hypothetical protein
MTIRSSIFRFLALILLAGTAVQAAPTSSTVDTAFIESAALRDNRVGLNTRRSLKVYLPAGYSTGKQRYPVIYMLHGLNWSNERMFAPDSTIQSTFDRAIASGVIKPFIAVAPDYTTGGPGTFFANSPTSGRFEDFTVDEVVPFIDSNYRTIARAEGRALLGEHMGGYGALLYAFHRPDIWSSVYGAHPVGTGLGLVPMWSRPNYELIREAKTFADLTSDPFTPVFVVMAQTFLPNANRPPFYCDFMADLSEEGSRLDVNKARLLRERFMLEYLVDKNLDKVKALRGIKFDWARYDPNQDHVYANQAFTRKLEESGVEHEAEEFRGLPWDKYWNEDGRVINDVLPFFAKRLTF